MRIVAIIFALLFTISAALQYNDPDPFLWVCIYGFAAVLSILYFLGLEHKALYAIPLVLYAAGMVYLWPEQYLGVTGKMSEAPEIELARESLGLGICALAFLLYLLVPPKKGSIKK